MEFIKYTCRIWNLIMPCRSLASSSKQHESGHHEADTVHGSLPDGLARLSLGDSDGTAETFGRSDSGSDIPGGRPELSGTPRMSHGVKRKSELEDREVKFKHLSVQDYLKLVRCRTFNRSLHSTCNSLCPCTLYTVK